MKRIMKKRTVTKSFALVLSGAIVFSAMQPMKASATQMLPSAGIASIIENELSVEEYVACAQEAQGALWGYTNLGIANHEKGNLNVRSLPTTEGKMVGKMKVAAACEVLEVTQDGWAHIQSGEVEGYVSMEFLLTGPEAKIKAEELVHTVVMVDGDGLNVRTKPSTDSTILTQVPKGEELEYIETVDGWIKVSIDDEEAYVSQDYVTVVEKLDTAITMKELMFGQGVSDVRVALVEYAKQFLGNPYVWGGTSLTKGADCSGFVLSVFKNYGYTLPHYSVSQSESGKKISASELKPGDLVFYANGKGTINHVSIYIGDGQVIHASNPKSGIKISKYNYRTPVKCVRIIND